MFFAAAQTGRNRFFFYLITISAVILAQVIGQLPLVWFLTTNSGMKINSGALTGQDLNGMEQNVLLFFLLIPFVCGLIALWICMKYLHQRTFKSLITPLLRIKWHRIFRSFIVWLILMGLVEITYALTSHDQYVLNFKAGPFIVLLIISILILPLQTSFEELFFRGYLMQGLGNLFKSPLVALVTTSVAFGLMHIWNPEITEFGIVKMLIYYISFGLFLGGITIIDSTLELPLGIHAANNVYSAVIVGFSGSALQTPSLFYLQDLDVNFMLSGYVMAVVIYAFVFFRKSNYKIWKRLFI